MARSTCPLDRGNSQVHLPVSSGGGRGGVPRRRVLWIPSEDQVRCQPVPGDCSYYGEAECSDVEGCTWGQGCTGDQIACSTFDSESDCAAHRYCSWRIRPDFN